MTTTVCDICSRIVNDEHVKVTFDSSSDTQAVGKDVCKDVCFICLKRLPDLQTSVSFDLVPKP